MRTKTWQFAILAEIFLLAILIGGRLIDKKEQTAASGTLKIAESNTNEGSKNYIKWVDFTAPSQALTYALQMDIYAHENNTALDWVSLLAYTAARSGGDFNKKAMQDMEKMAETALEKADATTSATSLIDQAAADLKYYPYYKEAYSAILSGMAGPHQVQVMDETGKTSWQEAYGLKAYSPIAKGFDYSDYDDFGTSRSYGYSRPHLGHDMMGLVGTPIRMECRSKNSSRLLSIIGVLRHACMWRQL